MTAWLESLPTLQLVFAFIAIPSTLVLIVQTVLLLIGMSGADADADFDPDGIDVGDVPDGDSGLVVFSVRGIVAMLCIAGWSGIVWVDAGLPDPVAIILASLCGGAALVGMAYLMKAVMRLQSSGNIRLGSAVGKVGEVYIPIPAAGEGKGKISINVQERLIEVDAITMNDTALKTGETVRVVSTDEAGLVVVERVAK